MNKPIAASLIAGAFVSACALEPAITSNDFPPPVIYGVTVFPKVVPQVALPNTDVPPANIWGVTKFAQEPQANLGPGGSKDPPITEWSSFGVVKASAK